ncbi:MAG: hypothetical protein KC486_24470 [Myxococcales bacterium]|nr:hypothetical protein [Myxococcales bacterium]
MRSRNALVLLSTLFLACAGDDTGGDATATEGETSGSSGSASSTSGGSDSSSTSASTGGASETGTSGTSDATTGTSGTTGSTTGNDTGGLDMLMCGQEPPPGAEVAPPPPTFGGICPTLELGFLEGDKTAPNEVMTAGGPRRFAVVAPEEIAEGERLPVIFMWHWLGGSAHSFWERSEVTSAAEELRFIAVIPESKDDILFKWPFTVLDTDERVEEEFAFFDDMLACVAEQFDIDENCVSSTGVSAGALFTGQLAGGRGEYLSAIMPLSGGTGGLTVKPWKSSKHAMPALVLWGGRDDFCVAVDFNETSMDLEAGLEADGHFVTECIHNCGHSTPPFDVPMGFPTFAPLWMFALDHPYWLDDGDSPYVEAGGLPVGYPEWCAVGIGNADIRTGECGPDECS